MRCFGYGFPVWCTLAHLGQQILIKTSQSSSPLPWSNTSSDLWVRPYQSTLWSNLCIVLEGATIWCSINYSRQSKIPYISNHFAKCGHKGELWSAFSAIHYLKMNPILGFHHYFFEHNFFGSGETQRTTLIWQSDIVSLLSLVSL